MVSTVSPPDLTRGAIWLELKALSYAQILYLASFRPPPQQILVKALAEAGILTLEKDLYRCQSHVPPARRNALSPEAQAYLATLEKLPSKRDLDDLERRDIVWVENHVVTLTAKGKVVFAQLQKDWEYITKMSDLLQN